ncbi:MAG TPA: hypothetical protein VLF18_06095 [Tahibacter sp.]|uniref:hypothetical protein n=1 Tax=Tahibacter sp. TaxID=2056211 RepID=UPI002B5C3550|nr:hypothetical protein [Tahibacter sp.]HSX59750.1 hypothetical protein [Tahibacter sp.]
MKFNRLALGLGIVCFAGFCTVASAQTPGWEQYRSQVRVKRALADSMTPEQYAAHVDRMAQLMAAQAAGTQGPTPNVIRAPGDTCVAATPEISALPYNSTGSTVSLVDNFDLPADTTNPTCAAGTSCTGAGPAGSLPFGAIYTGTGTGPDQAFSIRTDANCALTIGMTPTGGQDLALMLYQNQCSSALADCGCVADTGVANGLETITLNAVAGTQYFVVIDGYSAGATPPGPSGPFNLQITGTGCNLTPVQLQSFGID